MKKFSILVVEDIKAQRESLSAVLRQEFRESAFVVSVSSAKEANEVIEDKKKLECLVFKDTKNASGQIIYRDSDKEKYEENPFIIDIAVIVLDMIDDKTNTTMGLEVLRKIEDQRVNKRKNETTEIILYSAKLDSELLCKELGLTTTNINKIKLELARQFNVVSISKQNDTSELLMAIYPNIIHHITLHNLKIKNTILETKMEVIEKQISEPNNQVLINFEELVKNF